MLKKLALVCLIVPFALVGPLAAQAMDPDIGPPDVLVKLVPQEQGQPRKLVIGPRGVAVCKSSADCATFFTVTWIGSRNDGEKVEIRFTSAGAAECFDDILFTVDDIGPQHRQTVNVRADNPNCSGKSAFFYTVSCIGGATNNCGGVAPVDPGAMVEGGG